MRTRHARARRGAPGAGVVAAACAIAAAVACGSRTGLLATEHADASIDSGPDAPADAGPRDAVPDVLPPIDVTPPRDAVPSDCPDAAATLVYVITSEGTLLSFYPPSATFKTIGTIDCPGSNGQTPNSMAVDRKGIAYAGFQDGHLYRISTATAACQATSFVPGQGFTLTFGMGFSADTSDPDETLFVASLEDTARLATIDTKSFLLSIVGTFAPAIPHPELTGTGGGDLFAFYSLGTSDSAIAQIDKQTGALTGEAKLPGVGQGSGWAFAFWGGDFFTFTAPAGKTVVTRYRPSDQSITPIVQTSTLIVGAGVSTCAPQQ